MFEELQADVFDQIAPHFSSSAEKAIKELLEKKHLYQTLHIELPEFNVVQDEMACALSSIIGGGYDIDLHEMYQSILSSSFDVEWRIIDPNTLTSVGLVVTNQKFAYPSLRVRPPTVKLYCGICKRTEAYNLVQGQDLLEEFRKDARLFTEPVNEQVFSLAYQCQSCKSIPEIFIVRRSKNKLIQSGRTPMEQIEVPSFLPKHQRKFFSAAQLAFNSGQILAGNFLLRTLIEQYVRELSFNPQTSNLDDLFSEYSSKLPDDFKWRFPSLKAVYDRLRVRKSISSGILPGKQGVLREVVLLRTLSADIHGAGASEAIFTKAKSDIEEHFEAKKLFKLVDGKEI